MMSASQLPTEKTDEQKAARMKIFEAFDPNGNGYVSLAECDRGCRDILNLPKDDLPPPVIMRAYQTARSVAQNEKNSDSSKIDSASSLEQTKTTTTTGRDYLELSEFRLFLVYLKYYLELWSLFSSMDNNQDRRISYEEFQSIGWTKLMEWGIISMNDDAANDTTPQALFDSMDKNGGGMILFEEFSQWAVGEAIKIEQKNDS